MKKIIFIMLSLMLLVGCNKKEEKQDEVIDDKKENVEPKEEEKYIDNNPIELSFYMYYGKNTNRKRLEAYQNSFITGQDLCSLEIYYTKEEMLSINSQKNLWDQYLQNYSNIDNYKIGYKISFTNITNENISKYILSPKDTEDVFNYIQLYLYDDIHVQNGAWYSHVTEGEYNANTILTSIKLTGGDKASEVTSDITLEVFTYDDDDFDELGNYRGKSKATIIISRS
ncbi:MAG: hypothetical protein HFI87_07290 [Bacilli bacterium]|nr:hypothetical protein [Bacilli bacterium]